jgi:hypothetical protein
MIMKSYFQIKNYEMEKKIWQENRAAEDGGELILS